MESPEAIRDEAQGGNLLTAKQVASQLAISEKTVYDYVSKGLMPFIKIQTNVRFRAEAIRQWVAQKEYTPRELAQGRKRAA
jgi:excisionase family DNA binding protein